MKTDVDTQTKMKLTVHETLQEWFDADQLYKQTLHRAELILSGSYSRCRFEGTAVSDSVLCAAATVFWNRMSMSCPYLQIPAQNPLCTLLQLFIYTCAKIVYNK